MFTKEFKRAAVQRLEQGVSIGAHPSTEGIQPAQRPAGPGR